MMKKFIPYLLSGLVAMILVLLLPDTLQKIFAWKDAHSLDIMIVILSIALILVVFGCSYNKIKYGTFLHPTVSKNNKKQK